MTKTPAARLVVALFIVLALSAIQLPVGALSWDAPAFSLKAADIAPEAAKVTTADGADVVVLYQEDSFTFDASGAAVHTARIIYRILTRDGVSKWSTASTSWQPWRQDTPVLRARVISKAGVESTLDPSTIANTTARSDQPDLYTDERALQAPLPNLEVGCVVEYLITISDRAPLLAGSALERVWFGFDQPVLARRLIIDYPSASKVQTLIRGPGTIITSRETAGNRMRVRLDESGYAGIPAGEDYLTADAFVHPCVDFSFGGSWADVARAYAAMTDPLLTGAGLSTYAASALSGTAANAPADARVAAILYTVRKDVRYTGIEFGENAILPRAAADTLARGYGDCKDQAILLAATLRAVGIDARLALLMSGDAADVSPGLPGINLFNHAIVYLPGLRVWVDPTADFYPPGVLPPGDQGRRALVIAADTTGLVSTPDLGTAGSFERDVREIRLSESGPAAVTETSDANGAFGASYRNRFELQSASEIHDGLEGYAKSAFNASSLVSYTLSDIRSMETPFTITLQARDARVGWTDDSSAVATLRAGDLLSWLPSFLGAQDKDGVAFTRANDMRLWEPYRAEIVYKVLPPPGYRAAALPPNRVENFGPAHFSQVYRLEKDGSVTADFTFDCVKRTWTPAETVAFHTAARAFYEGNAASVSFEQVGQSLLSAGQFREALGEFQALANLHPAEALHHIQLSNVLLAAGFGEDAQAEARRAVVLEPSSAQAHINLGWELLHDPFGRLLGPGVVISDARAEYAKAAALDPSDTSPTSTLAILYEYNDALVRYGAGADLAKAVSLYRSIASTLRASDTWDNVAIDLIRLGRMQEVRTEFVTTARTATQRAAFVAAVAATDGTAAAQREAARLVSAADERRGVLSTAGGLLLVARQYAPSAELLLAGARGTQNLTQTMALADMLKNLTIVDPSGFTAATPRGIILAVLAQGLAGGDTASQMAPLVSASVRDQLTGSPDDADIAGFLSLESTLSQLPFPREIVLDLAAQSFTFQVLTDGPATAVLMGAQVMPPEQSQVIYLTRESGAYRVLDTEGPNSGIARECLALLAAGRLDDARAWVRLLRTQHATAGAFRDLTKEPFFSLLPASGEPSAADITRAAAYALARDVVAANKARGVDLLLPAWRSEVDKDKRRTMGYTLSYALADLGRTAELLDVTKSLIDDSPYDRYAIGLRVLALYRSSQAPEAEAMLKARATAQPGNLDVKRQMMEFYAGAGRAADAAAVAAQILDAGGTELEDYNMLAWSWLFSGVPSRATVDARQIVQKLSGSETYAMHTLVCLLADTGRFLEAQEAFGKYLDAKGSTAPDGSAWLAFGMMAERFGLQATAIAAYRKVTPGRTDWYTGNSAAALALVHLKALGASP